MIPAFLRQRQADLYGFKDRLIFIDSSRPARATQRPYCKTNKEASKRANSKLSLKECYWPPTETPIKLNKEAGNTFDLLRAGCYPRLIYINFFGSFLPNLHIEQQNKRSRVCVSEFSICVWELKGLSRTWPRSQKFSIWLPCPRHVPVYYSTLHLTGKVIQVTTRVKAAGTVPAFPASSTALPSRSSLLSCD